MAVLFVLLAIAVGVVVIPWGDQGIPQENENLLLDAIDAMKNLESFRFEESIETRQDNNTIAGQGTSNRSEGVVVQPDRLERTTRCDPIFGGIIVTGENAGRQRYRLIRIAGEVYSLTEGETEWAHITGRNATGPYEGLCRNALSDISEQPGRFVKRLFLDDLYSFFEEYGRALPNDFDIDRHTRFRSAEIAEGQATYLQREAKAGDQQLTAEAWIGLDDDLIRRLRVTFGWHGGCSGPVCPGLYDTLETWEIDVRFSDFSRDVVISTPPGVAPLPTPISSPFGPMKLYKSDRFPVRFEYPSGGVLDGRPFEGYGRRGWALNRDGLFGVDLGWGYLEIIEDSDEIHCVDAPEEFGGYAECNILWLEDIETSDSAFEILSRERYTTTSGDAVELLRFAGHRYYGEGMQLIYLQKGRVGVTVTYSSEHGMLSEYEELIRYSFNTFEFDD